MAVFIHFWWFFQPIDICISNLTFVCVCVCMAVMAISIAEDKNMISFLENWKKNVLQRQWSDLDADLRICNFSNRYYELKTYLFKKNTHTVPRKEHSIKSFNDFIRNRLWILVYFHFQHTVCDPNSIQRISHAFFSDCSLSAHQNGSSFFFIFRPLNHASYF